MVIHLGQGQKLNENIRSILQRQKKLVNDWHPIITQKRKLLCRQITQ